MRISGHITEKTHARNKGVDKCFTTKKTRRQLGAPLVLLVPWWFALLVDELLVEFDLDTLPLASRNVLLMVPRARVELARLAARDFESRASTDSAIGATL